MCVFKELSKQLTGNERGVDVSEEKLEVVTVLRGICTLD
jgi:hypothetical protein